MRQGLRRLKGIKVIVKPNGRRYVYRRVGAMLVSLPDLPENHSAFLAAYAAAGEAKPPPRLRGPDGSIAALCGAYLASGAHRRKATSTQAVLRRVIEKIAEDRGAGLLRDLRPDHIRKDVRKLTPGAASNRLKAWRAMLNFAVDEGMIEASPAAQVRAPTGTVKGHRQWTRPEVEAYRAHWRAGTPERLAFEVIFWTGARCVDAVRLGSQMLDRGWLSFVQAKTGGAATCPISALPAWCGGMASDHRHLVECLPRDRMQWIVTQTGKPRSVKGMSQWFSASASAAGLPDDCTAHGLRKARAAALAESGASTHQIGAWLGHASLSEIAHYTRAADQIAILAGNEQSAKPGNRVAEFPKRAD